MSTGTQEACRARAEAELHEEHASMHEQRLADDELIDDGELDGDRQLRQDGDLAADGGTLGGRESAVGANGGAVAARRVAANPERER